MSTTAMPYNDSEDYMTLFDKTSLQIAGESCNMEN